MPYLTIRKKQKQLSDNMSNKHNQPQFRADQSLILTTPAHLVGASLQNWQDFCKTAICLTLDQNLTQELVWINSELTSILIDDIRSEIAQLQFGVASRNYRLVFILAADLASAQVQNALLKILEEPPAKTTIILATSNPASLISTILSRCQIIPLTTESIQEITDPDLIADLATLTNFCRQPEEYSFGQLSLLASKYKDKITAKNFITSWLNLLIPDLVNANANQFKLARLSLQFQDWLTQNLNPVLALEQIFFTIKKNHQPQKT